MPKLVWDQVGEHFYETGVDHGVLYIPDATGAYATGVAWNGLTTVTESPTGAEGTAQYADNIKYLNLFSYEEFGGTVEAFTYPDEFAEFDGYAVPADGVFIGQQPRKPFGLCYRTRLGNDIEAAQYGYKLHMVYGAMASPSEKAYATINDSPEAIAFSWAITTTPVAVTGFAPTSLVVVDCTTVDPTTLQTLLDALYGDDSSGIAHLPMPDEIITMLGATTGPATGATAGTPGTWTPSGSTPPANAAGATSASIVASPSSAWTTGQYVQGSTAGSGGQMYWNGTAWTSGMAP